MIADLRFKKTTIFITVSTVITLLVLAAAYSGARTKAYAKLDPYAITFSVLATQESNLILAYDYGYGINKDHQRVIALPGLGVEQNFRVSLSSWKTLRNIAFIASADNDYQLKSFTISRANSSLNFDSAQLSQSAEDGNIIYRLSLEGWEH